MNHYKLPDQVSLEITITGIFEYLFPEIHASDSGGREEMLEILKNQVKFFITEMNVKEGGEAEKIFDGLEKVRETLLGDANFILESDPAAKELIEVIAIYPGFFAIFCYRIAHSLFKLGVPMLPRIITEYAHRVTGIDIHPGAEIGSPFSIDHGTGIVIGETTRIGHNVKLYQGVTLGALSVEKNKAARKRHPTIEDNVILYAGCTVLGGDTVIGKNSIIGGNVWLTTSVKPFSVVYNKSEIVIRDQRDIEGPLNFII